MWHEFSVKEDMGEAVAEIPAPPGRAVYNRAELRVTQQEPLRATKTVNFGNVVILNEPVEVRVEPPGGDSSPAPSSKPKQSPSKRAASIYTSSGSKIFKRKPRQPAPVQPPSVLDFDDREVFGQPPLPVPDWMLAKPVRGCNSVELQFLCIFVTELPRLRVPSHAGPVHISGISGCGRK